MVNAYNPIILLNWQANMDIQLVNGPLGVAYYVCSYVCKAEPDTLKNALSETLKNIENSVPAPSLRSSMSKIGFCILKHRTLSAQEAAYRIGHLQLTWNSREIVKIVASSPENQYKKLKPQSNLNTLSSNSSDIFEYNNFDYYYARPEILKTMSLFTFCRLFRITRTCPKKLEFYKLNLPKDIYIQKRSNPAVVRICKPQRGTEEYYYSMLLLFLPHMTPSELVHPFVSNKDAFLNKCPLFDKEAVNVGYRMPDLEEAIRAVQLANVEKDMYAANTCENNTDPVVNSSFSGIPDHQSNEHGFVNNSVHKNDCNNTVSYENEECEWHTLSTGINVENLKTRLNMLTDDQRKVFFHIKDNLCKMTTKSHIFITGGAGVGKSFLIQVLVDNISLQTSLFSGSNPVLVLAPTGVAAHNIGGQTIHFALKMPIEHGYRRDSAQLSSATLRKLRFSYKNIHTIIIDEISMVSAFMLEQIHLRLQFIKDSELPFGGMNVILVGDFFQLRPVRGKFAFMHQILWPLFKPFFLCQNMRQSGDLIYANLLNKFRIGNITSEDARLLRTRLITENKLFKENFHIYPTRKQVLLHNVEVQKTVNEEQVEVLS